MGFKALNEVFDGRLALPGGDGKIYHIPEPDAELGLWCTAMIVAGLQASIGSEVPQDGLPPLQLDDAGEEALYRRILGPLWDELAADGHGFGTQRLFAQTGLIWIGAGQQAAEEFWNSGGNPKGLPPNRAARRQQTGSTPSTAGAPTTPSPASMSGTRRPHRR